MSKTKSILNKLFKSYIALVMIIGVLGWLISSTVTLHDSYVAHSALSRLKDFKACVDEICVNPNGSVSTELDKIELILLNGYETSDGTPNGILNREKYFRTKEYEEVLKRSGFTVYDKFAALDGRWGDNEMADISFLWICTLWLIGAGVVIGVSLAIKKWINWLLIVEEKTT